MSSLFLHNPLKRIFQEQTKRFGSTVRIIAVKDLPNGKAYEGDVLEVKAGYARNYLIPQKFAFYATRQNFEKLNMKDPDRETPAERRERLAKEAASGDDKALKAADLLKYYLRNKVVSLTLLERSSYGET